MVRAMAEGFQNVGWQVEVATRTLPQRTEYEVNGVCIRDIPVQGMQSLPGEAKSALLHDLESGYYQAVFAVAAPTCWVPWFFQDLKNSEVRLYHVTCINAQGYANWRMNPGFREPLSKLFRNATGGIITLTGKSYDTQFCREENIPFLPIPNGIDRVKPEGSIRLRLGIAADDYLLLHVGNFFPVKNQVGLMFTLAGMEGNWHLVFIGHEMVGQEQYFRQVQATSKMDRRFHVIRGMSREHVAGAMKEADLLLLSSEGEGAPLVLLEAMSHQLPWLARPTCGAALEYDGGIIAPLQRWQSLIILLLQRPDLRKRLGEAGLEHYEKDYQLEKMVQRYQNLLLNTSVFPQPVRNAARIKRASTIRKEIIKAEFLRYSAPSLSIILLDDERGITLQKTLQSLHNSIGQLRGVEILLFTSQNVERLRRWITDIAPGLQVHLQPYHSENKLEMVNIGFRLVSGRYVLILPAGSTVFLEGLTILMGVIGKESPAEFIFSALDHIIPNLIRNEKSSSPAILRFPGKFLLPAIASLENLPLFGFAVERDFFDRCKDLAPEFGPLAWQHFWVNHAADFSFLNIEQVFSEIPPSQPPAEVLEPLGTWLLRSLASRHGIDCARFKPDPRLPETFKEKSEVVLARSFARKGNLAEAEALLQKSLGIDPSAAVLTLLGQLYLKRDLNRALEYLDTALDLDPLYMPLFFLLRSLEQQLPPEWLERREKTAIEAMQNASSFEMLHHAMLKLTQFYNAPRAINWLIQKLTSEVKPVPPAVYPDQPEVSIIVPMYNGKRDYILQTLKSVQWQTFANWECIIVDDGVSDGTRGLVEQWLAQIDDPRYRIIHQEHRGASRARNTGVNEAKGEFISCIDCDDFFHQEFLEKLLQAFIDDEDVGWVYPLTVQFGKFNRIWGTDSFNPISFLQMNRCPSSSLVRRQMHEDLGGYDESMLSGYEDWDYWIKAIKYGWRGKQEAEILFFYRKLPSSLNENIDREKEISIKSGMMQRHPECYLPITDRDLQRLAGPRAFPSDLIRKDFLKTWKRRNDALRLRIRSERQMEVEA